MCSSLFTYFFPFKIQSKAIHSQLSPHRDGRDHGDLISSEVIAGISASGASSLELCRGIPVT